MRRRGHTLAHATFARFGRQPLGVDRLSGDAARQGSGVRSFGRSGFASEVRPCLSCCTERAHEMTGSPAIWKQCRLPVPPAAPMDRAPWCGGRVAPSPGTRAAIWVAFTISWLDLGQNGLCRFLLKTKPSQKKQAGPADAISYRVRHWNKTAR